MQQEEESKQNTAPESGTPPTFPYPYPSVRMIIAVFACGGLVKLAPMWNGGTVPNALVAAGLAVLAVLAAYCFFTGYRGMHLRNVYSLQQEEIRREEGRKIMAERNEEERRARRAAQEAAERTAKEKEAESGAAQHAASQTDRD